MSEAIVDALDHLLEKHLSAGEELVFDDFLSIVARAPGELAPLALDTEAVVAEFASLAGVEPRQARMKLAFQASNWRRDLLDGRATHVGKKLRLRLVAGETSVQAQSGTDRRLIQAGNLEIAGAASGELSTALAGRRLIVRTERAFQAELTRSQGPLILLALPERDLLAEAVEQHFSRRRWKVHTVSSQLEVESAVAGAPLSLVVCDERLPEAEAIARAVKTRPEAGPVSLVQLASGRGRPRDEACARVVGDARLDQPFAVVDLLEAISYELSRGDRRGSDVLGTMRIESCSRLDATDDACGLIDEFIAASDLDESGRVALSAASREACTNAARHGNRGDPSRLIEIDLSMTADALTLTFSDQGEGFDHAAAMAGLDDADAIDTLTERRQVGDVGGLGLLMLRRCVDELSFSARGNSLTLVKRIRRH